MDSEAFRKAAYQMVGFIVNYRENVVQRRVVPDVRPGYLRPLLPRNPPLKPEKWKDILKDTNDKIMPGVTHWQHPHFFAYFPSAASYPGVLADMLTGAIGSNGTSWAACPAATELETITMDWLARALGLPKTFIFSEPGSKGGGSQMTSASESCLVSMLTARGEAVKYLKERSAYPQDHDSVFLPRLVAYCSLEAHSSVEKAAMIALVHLRILDVDENSSLRGRTLQKAINADLAKGLHPFFVSTTLGTTGSTSFDNLKEIGPIVQDLPACWLHCDGAYGGCSFICPEMRGPMEGLELADSFNVNPYKWLLINFDCSALWVKDRRKIAHALVDTPLNYDPDHPQSTLEYRHWGIPLGRKFKSLKVWFTLRNYGTERLQNHIRNHCTLAKKFEALVATDDRFEVVNQVTLGLVCFRVCSPKTMTEEILDELNEELLDEMNESGLVHMIPSRVQGKYCIRFVVCHEQANEGHVEFAWGVIQKTATEVLAAKEKGTFKIISETTAFIREVPKEYFDRRPSTLSDFATPLQVRERKVRQEGWSPELQVDKNVDMDSDYEKTE